MKKKLSCVLFLFLLIASFLPLGASAADSLPFTDVHTSAWYYPAVSHAVGNGLFSGTSSTAFSPETPMNRGMFVTVLGRLHKVPDTYGRLETTPFCDVWQTDYYFPYAAWAKENGIVSGVEGGRLDPAGAVTREQIAAMLHRYFQKFGFRLVERAADFTPFSDFSSISGFAQEPMGWAVAYGILNGSGGRLDPQGQATRAQVAQMLLNFQNLTQYAASTEPAPPPPPGPTPSPLPDWQAYNPTYDIPTGRSAVDAGGGYYDYSLAGEIMEQIDRLRASRGAEPLKYNPKMQGWASIRAREHSIQNGHTRPDGSPCLSVGTGLEAENLYWGTGFTNTVLQDKAACAARIIKSWYESPLHQRAMLNKTYQLGAVSCYVKGDRVYAAHLFSMRNLYFMDFVALD